jgi:hypothetical protein
MLVLCERHARNAPGTDVAPGRLQQTAAHELRGRPDAGRGDESGRLDVEPIEARYANTRRLGDLARVLFFGSFLSLVVLAMSVR